MKGPKNKGKGNWSYGEYAKDIPVGPRLRRGVIPYKNQNDYLFNNKPYVVMEQPIAVTTISTLEDNKPQYALVKGLDLVIIRYGEEISVLYGRCLHREAMMADGPIAGRNIVYGVHGWDYRYDTGVSDSTNKGKHHKFSAWAKEGTLYGVGREIERFLAEHPQPFDREFYLGNCLGAINQFIKVIARSFGYDEMAKFQPRTYPPTVMKCIGLLVLSLWKTAHTIGTCLKNVKGTVR
jgi:nitrite reductase/ring-hydroxylating ferredoxin subunit